MMPRQTIEGASSAAAATVDGTAKAKYQVVDMEVDGNVPTKKPNKNEKLRCFRCNQPRHFHKDCTVIVCDNYGSP
jgi:hypothetical protein